MPATNTNATLKYITSSVIYLAAFIITTSNIVAFAKPLDSEKSKWGYFSLGFMEGDKCKLLFNKSTGTPQTLITVNDCINEGSNGLFMPEAVDNIGDLALPISSNNSNIEFHLFAVRSARGGNKCAGFDYFPVVVKNGKAWSPKAYIGGCKTIKNARIYISKHVNVLYFEVPPSTLNVGYEYKISMGSISVYKLPRLHRTTEAKQNITIIGQYSIGAHATNYLPFIAHGDHGIKIINTPDKCKLDKLHDGEKVLMSATQTIWNEGNIDIQCISIVPHP